MAAKRLLDETVALDCDVGVTGGKRRKVDADGGKTKKKKKEEEEEVAAAAAAPIELTIGDEVHRAVRVKALRTKLVWGAKQFGGVKAPLLCYERWQARSMLQDTADPLIPTGDEDAMLAHDLKRGGVTEPEKVAGMLYRLAVKSREEIKNPSKPNPPEADFEIYKSERYGRIDLYAGKVKEYQSVNAEHYRKLWTLYRAALECADDADVPEAAASAFDKKVYLLLLRYATLGGHGYQAGLTAEAFEVLHRRLRVSAECFASPLNCRYAKFCSAFPDTDAAFGSIGSFFEFAPTRGSFEANPPFVPETMSAMAERIDTLLAATEQPLSFCVIVPAWTEVRAWRQLTGSQYLRASFTVAARDHSFTDGAQHVRADLHRPSSYDSAVFILQNDAGARVYPVPSTLEGELASAMGGDCKRPITRANYVLVGEDGKVVVGDHESSDSDNDSDSSSSS